MKKTLSYSFMALTIVITSCANTPTENNATDIITTTQSSTINDVQIGSASPKDKSLRLAFLKDTLKEKNAELIKVNIDLNQGNNTEENDLTSEILTNEILLLEAEQFGLEQGFELPETEL